RAGVLKTGSHGHVAAAGEEPFPVSLARNSVERLAGGVGDGDVDRDGIADGVGALRFIRQFEADVEEFLLRFRANCSGVEFGYRDPLVWGVPVTAERLDLNVPAGRAIEVDVPHRGIGRPGARGLLGERLGIISREDPVLADGAVCAVWTWRQGDVRKVVLCPEVHRE